MKFYLIFVFFFQAEDGIRDIGVTGVQTCALPIFSVRVCASGGRLLRGCGRTRPAPTSRPRSWGRSRPVCSPPTRRGSARRSPSRARERKSVGEGKSGDLGGRRIIKKKKKSTVVRQ